MTTLENKVVIVTGGAEGIGRACVEEFARQGARIAVGDINESEGARSVEPLGDRGLFVRCDVSVASDCQALVQQTVDAFGELNAVMSNSGIDGNGTVETCDEEAWDRVINVNLKGMFLIAKYAVPRLRDVGQGAILNVGSVSSYWGEPVSVSYNAAKGGVLALTRAMAMDHGRDGIQVNCLIPGYHNTGMPFRFFDAQEDPAAVRAGIADLMAVRRMGEPEELARTAAFLLSGANPNMTGAAVVADGGLTAGHPWYS